MHAALLTWSVVQWRCCWPMVRTFCQVTTSQELLYRRCMTMLTSMLSICSCRKLLHTGGLGVMLIFTSTKQRRLCFHSILSVCMCVCVCVCLCKISQNVRNGFWWNFLVGFGVVQRTVVYIFCGNLDYSLDPVSEWVGFNSTSTQFRSLVPSLTRKSGTESPTLKRANAV